MSNRLKICLAILTLIWSQYLLDSDFNQTEALNLSVFSSKDSRMIASESNQEALEEITTQAKQYILDAEFIYKVNDRVMAKLSKLKEIPNFEINSLDAHSFFRVWINSVLEELNKDRITDQLVEVLRERFTVATFNSEEFEDFGVNSSQTPGAIILSDTIDGTVFHDAGKLATRITIAKELSGSLLQFAVLAHEIFHLIFLMEVQDYLAYYNSMNGTSITFEEVYNYQSLDQSLRFEEEKSAMSFEWSLISTAPSHLIQKAKSLNETTKRNYKVAQTRLADLMVPGMMGEDLERYLERQHSSDRYSEENCEVICYYNRLSQFPLPQVVLSREDETRNKDLTEPVLNSPEDFTSMIKFMKRLELNQCASVFSEDPDESDLNRQIRERLKSIQNLSL